MTFEVQVKKQSLANVRGQLQLSQRDLARLAGVSPTVISNSENGYPIRRLSAFAILNALNAKRADTGQAILDIDDLDWKIQGDGKE